MIYKVDFLTEEESDTIYNRILHLEPEIKALGEGRYGGTNKDSLTSRFVYYNGLESVYYTHLTLPTIYSV